jgi:hypothetical protein
MTIDGNQIAYCSNRITKSIKEYTKRRRHRLHNKESTVEKKVH